MADNPSATVNTFLSASRNTFLLSSVATATYVAGTRVELAPLRWLALAAVGSALCIAAGAIRSFTAYADAVENHPSMKATRAHAATDLIGWRLHIVALWVYIAAIVACVGTIMFRESV